MAGALDGVWAGLPSDALPVPEPCRDALRPASHCLHEWREYWLECPAADTLLVGARELSPGAAGWFRLRFENELGLARLRFLAEGRPLGEELWGEVISPKFRQPAEHVAFFRSLLDDLYQRCARLPFVVQGRRARW